MPSPSLVGCNWLDHNWICGDGGAVCHHFTVTFGHADGADYTDIMFAAQRNLTEEIYFLMNCPPKKSSTIIFMKMRLSASLLGGIRGGSPCGSKSGKIIYKNI